MNNNILTNRHDFLLLFEVVNGNPNGDPDAGNLPRLDPNTNRGLVSDVCLKRKVRNYLTHFAPPAGDGRNYCIFIQQGAVLNDLIDEAEPHANQRVDANKNRDHWEKEALDWLCRRYYDLRAFGAVLSTKNKIFKGSAYGQVRGPVQFTFGQSFHPITPLEVSITRCAVTNAQEKKEVEEAEAQEPGSGRNRTMGNKHIVPYALYVAKGYVSPAFAERTGFTQADLDLLWQALLHMFEHDRSAARGEMVVRGLYDFEHVGTQHPNNAEQNKREARLGCAHAHVLFEGIKVTLKPGRSFPESFADYDVRCEWTAENLPPGIVLHLRHEGRSIGPRRV
ncbi:type I-C CRISPR-associated protein Cas7/Csd2 [Limisphaera ngatamarikiensis]|uniref:Type I-C CRISPR-associated protein Cas7/Csd2 n=1 Tax=Limisphaera ngatamarikiensis TaxID=1324935 RepID=A0A6M1RRN2_9BACT|nr:type I-C CRISPR-associated protein Cas7/Csd2 [Limisphaera ngatamarikiensis]NGO37971.1 type I-C CRISPR-associated protein Cas7/Csd2 [Limisphaera ngatamarikiensis]